MSYPVMPLGFLGSQGDQDTYRIERSLRFNSADSAYLNRTPASAGNQKTWTWSGWVKRGKLGAQDFIIFNEGGLSSNYLVARFASGGSGDIIEFFGSAGAFNKTTSQVFRDPSAWYHLVFVMDATNTQARIYVNGVEASYSTNTNPSNANQNFNRAQETNIGRSTSGIQHFDGYLTEINFIDGQALTPSSFGETDAITGRWKAKAYSGTYGTNGFYLKFADNSGTTATTLGKDSSPNGNNWTPNNFSVTAGADNDSLLDSPTNSGTSGNYCTWNEINRRTTTHIKSTINGNLDVSGDTNQTGIIYATIYPATGKWYFEFSPANTYLYSYIGIGANNCENINQYAGNSTNSIGLEIGSGKVYKSSLLATYTAISGGEIGMIAWDCDTGKVWMGRQGTWFNSGNPAAGTGEVGTLATGENGLMVTPYLSSGVISSNFGQRPFAYTAPSGFKALCTTNLPTPTIQKPSKYMDVVTYTGNGSTQTISSLGFSPDLVWIKSRAVARSHRLLDTIRGVNSVLASDTTGAEYSSGTPLSSFNSNGFSLTNSDDNVNSETYVAWAWDEAPIAGMDIVAYTGDGTTSANRLINHSLGVKPDFVITKKRSGGTDYGWSCWHKDLGGNYGIWLDKTDARNVNMWAGYSNFSATKFTPPDLLYGNENGSTYVNYLFAEVEGFSKFGSYTGNGSTDGPFVFTGMRPRWVMIKRTDSAGSWYIIDTARGTTNVVNPYLLANASNTEASDLSWDILSNGFKLRSSYVEINNSGGTYIFAAFAESPFKYARAR